MAEYLDKDGLTQLCTNIENTYAKKSDITAYVQLVISTSQPASGSSNMLWIDSNNSIMYYYNGSSWTALGAVWK